MEPNDQHNSDNYYGRCSNDRVEDQECWKHLDPGQKVRQRRTQQILSSDTESSNFSTRVTKRNYAASAHTNEQDIPVWVEDKVGHKSVYFEGEPPKQKFRTESSQMHPNPVSGYNAFPYHRFIDNRRKGLNMAHTHNLAAPINSQRELNRIDGMARAPSTMSLNASASMNRTPTQEMTTNSTNTAISPAFGVIGNYEQYPNTMNRAPNAMTRAPNPMIRAPNPMIRAHNPMIRASSTMTVNASSSMNMTPAQALNSDSTNAANRPVFSTMMNCEQYMKNPVENVMMGPVKEIIHLTKSVLYPPNPNFPPPSTRDRPPGCKTIFVGGLPAKITEEIVREVFEKCGEILTIRMSRKNFCHIRFASEAFVYNALSFSGYRIKIENKDDTSYTGRLHVDYGKAREDQHEYECHQRALEREARHKERLKPKSKPRPIVPPYSDQQVTSIGEKLRSERTFQKAIFTLITWLERGECNKKNSGFFYSMIQSTNSHVRKLMCNKVKYEEELNKAKLLLKKQMQGLLFQFNEIGKVFNSASLKKVWDHFTKAQRKNIELWKKQTEEIKNLYVEEVISDRIEDEMDVSDDEGDDNDNSTKKSPDEDVSADEQKCETVDDVNELKEEIESLHCQLEAAQNEIAVLRSEIIQQEKKVDGSVDEQKDEASDEIKKLKEENKSLLCQLEAAQNEIEILQSQNAQQEKTVQGMQEEIILLTQQLSEGVELRDFKMRCRDNLNIVDGNLSDKDHPLIVTEFASVSSTSSSFLSITDSEACWFSLICTFLNIPPFKANINDIYSYVQQRDCTATVRDIENLMRRFPTVFKEEYAGPNSHKKWILDTFTSQM